MVGWLTAGLTTAILGTLLWNAERRIDNLKTDAAQWRVNVATVNHAHKVTRATLDECKAINHANADQRDSAVDRAELAEGHVEVLARLLQESIKLELTETEFPDSECRTLADPLPVIFADSLCLPSSGNCAGD